VHLDISNKPARCNTTVIGLCRRLLEDAEHANIHVTWVKVRGHSSNRGNDMADAVATRGMDGHTDHLVEVAVYVNNLLAS
jgi:ribonuclease HI